MIYLVIPVFLIIYFEIFGTILLKKLNYSTFNYNSTFGFIVFIGLLYVIMPIFLYLHTSTVVLWCICSLMFIITLIFILFNIKLFKFKFSYSIVFILFFILIEYFKFKNSALGFRWFDHSAYLTYVSSIIEFPNLNYFNIRTGIGNNLQASDDYFQVFYHFSAYVVWIGRIVFQDGLKIVYDYMPGYIWSMSIMFICFFITSVFNFIEKLKIKSIFTIIFIYIFVGLFIGNLYWNNIFAFFGNTYRGLISAYVIYFVFEYIKQENSFTQFFLLVSIWALSATSLSGVYFSILVVYSFLFIIYKKDDNTIKHIVLLGFVPIVNISIVFFDNKVNYIVMLISIIMIMLYFLNDNIMSIVRKYKLLEIMLIVVPIVLVALSLINYGIVDNLKVYFDPLAVKGDMVWEYFQFKSVKQIIVNLFIYILIIVFLLRNKNTQMKKFLFVILITFLNPLSAALMKSYVLPFYRSFDLVFNIFTYCVFISELFKILENRKFSTYIIKISLIIIFFGLSIFYYFGYEHESFIPTSDFNYIYKIDNDEVNSIKYVDGVIRDNNLKNVKVIWQSLYFRVFQPKSYNMYNRYYTYYKRDDDKELFDIFYPLRDFSERKDDNLYDYEQVMDYIYEGKYDFIIEDKNISLYNVEREFYYPRYNILNYYMPIQYENERYVVFWTYLDK